MDSVEVRLPDGSVEVQYHYHPLTSEHPIAESQLSDTVAADEQNGSGPKSVSGVSRPSIRPVLSTPGPSTSYSVGSIPVESSVSPSGARLYSIPISTVSGWNLAPSVSLVYNSQSSNGVAGYGWHISGLSSIEVRNESWYYDGNCRGGIYGRYDTEYSLDGNPIVLSDLDLPGYEYATARGRIQISKHTNDDGVAMWFKALYPDGRTAIYGFPDGEDIHGSYPLTELRDKEGNVINFYYYLRDNVFYVSSIEYGEDARMVFNYTERQDTAPYLHSTFGAQTGYPGLLLTSVVSYDGNAETCRYPLAHEYLDGVTLLKQVGCSSASGSLPPLTFSYNIDDEEEARTDEHFQQENQVSFDRYFEKSDDTELLYLRGRLIPGCHNDGIIVLPSYSTYERIDRTGGDYKYGSAYASDQALLLDYTYGTYHDFQEIFYAGSGFQLISPADIDGDGTDEIIRVNNSSSTAGITNFSVTRYSFDSSGHVSSSTFGFNINDGTHNNHYNNPAKCFYYLGDFRGNGKTMLLVVSRDHSKFGLVDLESGQLVSESTLFAMSDDESQYVFVADFEGDGKDDLCHVTSYGLYVYSISSIDGTYFTFRKNYPGVTQSSVSSDPLVEHSTVDDFRLGVSDINGDGYPDLYSYPTVARRGIIVYYDPSTINLFYFTGEGFSSLFRTLLERDHKDRLIFLDADKDGLPDVLHIKGDKLYCISNRNGKFTLPQTPTYTTLSNLADLIPGDATVFGDHCDVAVMDGPFLRCYKYGLDHGHNRRIAISTDSHGTYTGNVYGNISGYDGCGYTDLSRTYSTEDGFCRSRIPLTVLSTESTRTARHSEMASRDYVYTDAVTNSRGLGFCGFGAVEVTDNVNLTRTARKLDPERFGVVLEEKTALRDGGQPPFSTVVNTWDRHTTDYGFLDPRMTRSVATDALTGLVTTTTFGYDDYDFPDAIVTTRNIGQSSSCREQLLRFYDHSLDTTHFILGGILEESLITEGDDDPDYNWEERTTSTLDTLMRPVARRQYVGMCEETIPFDVPNLVSETRWTYDGSGNVTSEKTAPYGSTTFTGNTYAYDECGRYLLFSTDALGFTTAYDGYGPSGRPSEVTDHRGHTTFYTYDSWGNLLETEYPDGSVETVTRSWTGDGAWTVAGTATGAPESVIRYDALGRETARGEKRFDGQWQWTQTTYDTRGRVSAVSLPYRGSQPSQWTTYAYDAYGRKTSVSEASGRQTTWSYDGASTTTVRDGISTTATVDATGRTVSVTDAGGTVSYVLRDDGQPSAVTAPGGVLTTLTYDDWGRRSSIIDPSSGLHTDSYTWNSDGSSSTTHTGPHGTLTTAFDRFGRTLSVQRQGEFGTSYTYDTNGLLTAVQSTNGTSTEYTYDSLERLATVKDSAPGGIWFKQTISYGAGSNVSTVSYETQDGPVTTETHRYANGTETGVFLPDSTSVFLLTAENDPGLPTAVMTGSVQRSYTYTAAGLPTGRTMAGGALQNLACTFDGTTGNLSSRTDASRSLQETFSYDNLGRLTMNGQRPMTYASNGNVTAIGGVGTMSYADPDDPYLLTGLTPEPGSGAHLRTRTVAYGCDDRPLSITEGTKTAAFTLNADGDRVRMRVTDGTSAVLTRWYLGDRYERDSTAAGTEERLYLGGGAYSAPMVCRKVGGGAWTPYNIGRDHLGNITTIATVSGAAVAEYSYDAWGRLRNPATQTVYTEGQEPALFLGRGFCGHEHLPWFGLVNMNARLYDPLTGRFLSPDPYVQAPDFTQNFNRYSYALNNPLKYTDESGELLGIDDAVIIGALIVAGVSMAIDYGIQVFSNYIESKNNPDLTPEDIWFNKIDWFDIGISGIIGGITGGYGTAAESGHVISKFGAFLLKHTKLVKAGEILLTSAVDITGEGVQDVTFKQFSQRFVTGIVNMEISDQLSKTLSKNNSLVEENVLPEQTHHFATNKNKVYTPQMQEIASKYGLDLDGDWNKALMRHLGRHPNEYHDFVLQTMYLIDSEAAGDTQKFLNLFDIYIKQVVLDNPELLRKSGWRF